jgi:nucleotide-binding universal stress UspA family protein
MKTILVPTDYSDAAKNAADYAVNFAKEINARVLLFHAYSLPIVPSPDALILVPTAAEWNKDNEDLLKIEVARLRRKTNVEIGYKAVMGLAVDEIKEEEKKAEFIVMGITGAGALSETILGSITTATLKKISKPVIVIPEHVHYKNPERIVLASDLDPLKNAKILDKLNALVAQFKSVIYIVNVKEKKDELTVANAIAEVQLDTTLKDVEHFYYYPENENPVEGINEFVKAKKADMVAVVPHHHTFVERLFHRSFSKKMAFHTHVPLLVLPDNDKVS